jgi:sirohydrochlorin ferrochelatase
MNFLTPTRPLRMRSRQHSRLRCVASLFRIKANSNRRKNVGVVIVDHGSRKSAANDMLDDVVDMYKACSASECFVTKAHMELARPSIMDAVKECRDTAGAEMVIVAPYFLSNGRHVQEDIPILVQEAERELGVKCVVAGHLGVDPGLIQVVINRVDSAYHDLNARKS